jgi:membrane-bound lytic murein transglycosylase D
MPSTHLSSFLSSRVHLRALIVGALALLPGSLWASYGSPSSFPTSNARSFRSDDVLRPVGTPLTPTQRSAAPAFDSTSAHQFHEFVLNDSGSRISEEFRVPAPMRNTVSMWLRIYTEFNTEQTVLFDKKHPDVVYEVMDFRDLKRNARNAMAYEIMRERRLKKRIAEFKAAFRTLSAKAKRIKRLTPDHPSLNAVEKKILAAISTSQHSHSISAWGREFRAQTGQRDQVVKGLIAAETFFPKMEQIFEEMGVPKELTRIPLVESSFNVNAHSKAGAQGVWQFMPASGKEYMVVDPANGIDERLSPLKSTVAAARLLRRNLIIAGNWPLAITAYNHGYTGIKVLSPKERATALDGSLFDLCSSKKKTLGYASSNYYAEFLALLHAEAYKDLFYGDTPMPIAPTLTFHKVSSPISVTAFASRNGIPLRDFRSFNPDVKNMNAKLPKGFYVIMPGKEGEIDELISSIKAKIVRTRSPKKTRSSATTKSRATAQRR